MQKHIILKYSHECGKDFRAAASGYRNRKYRGMLVL